MNCRSCGGHEFGDVINLGSMPLVNNLLKRPDDDCPRWPLKVVFCRACSLAQLTEVPPPPLMFDEYVYFSSQSQTMVAHAGELVKRFVKPRQFVVEIASNDGYLLRQAKKIGARVLGVDPARNIAAFANDNGVATLCQYFNEGVAARIAREHLGGADGVGADVIFANNVLAHVPDPNEIAAGIKRLLAPQGVAHIEVPYIMRMIESRAFDTIYHEHHCYFSQTALRELFQRHALKIVHVEEIEIHGGSLHLQIAHEGDERVVNRWCDREVEQGILDASYYADFADRVAQLKTELVNVLDDYESVAAFGAAAKGIVLLNYFELGVDRIRWVADVSPHKQGRFVPGTRQAIVAPDELLRRRPQAALLLAWNICDEIVRRNRAYLDQGGRFIVPIPEVAIL